MKVEDEISRLKREIENLVEERDVLLEVSEDYQILSNLSERVNSLDTEREVIAEILESVSILKDLPVAMFLKNEDGVFRVEQELLHANIRSRLNEEFAGKDYPALGRVPKNGRFILLEGGAPAGNLGFLPVYQGIPGFKVCYLMPMYVRHEVHGVFVFCSSLEAAGAHERTMALFNRLIQTAASRIDNIRMVLDIERLNQKLTERYRERGRRLSESEAKFGNLADQSPNMIFINIGGRVVYANKMCEEKMGYSMEELLSPDFDFRRLIAPESMDLVRENMKRHQKGENIPPYEYKLITKDGREITGIHTTKLIDYEGEKAILGIITDITERKRAEQALLESEERYRSLFENSIEGVAISKGSKAITANKAVLDMFGYDRVEEFTGIPLLDHVAPESREFILDRIKRRQRGETLDPHFEYKIICKDGSIKDVEATTTGVTINNELYSLGTFRDVTERKRAEIALKESEKKYRDLADNNLVGVYQTNLKGDILYLNKAMAKIAGLKNPVEMKSINAVMRYKDPRARDALIKRLQKEGRVDDFEFEALTASGEPKHLMIAASLDGDVISGIMMDITERKQAEEQIRMLKEFQENVIDESPVVMEVVNRDLVVTSWNRAAEEYTQVKKENILGKKFFEVIPSLKKLGWDKIFRKVIETGEPYSMKDYRITRTFGPYKGQTWYQDVNVVPLREGSKISGAIITVNDITERKMSEEKLEALLDIGQQITRTIDLDSLLEIAVKKISLATQVDRVSIALQDKGKWVVRAAYSKIEKKPTFAATELNLRDFPKMDEAVRKKKTVYVEDSQDPKTQTKIEIAVAKKLKIGSGVHVPLIARGKVIGLLNFAAVGKARKFTKKDIEYFETIANALSLMVANAELYEGLKDFSKTLERKVAERTAELEKARDSLSDLLEDVTRANKALEEANLKLLEADRLKSVFLASMSHELRTPLNSIIGFTGMVLQGMAGALNKEQKKQLEIANSNALHLLKLIEELLDISKIEADRIGVSPEEFSLAGLIDEVAAGFMPEIQRKGLELKKDVVDAAVFTDRRLYKQIIMNLLENAVKYTEKGGIKIDAYTADDRFMVRVKDTGKGIKKKDLPLIFEPFTRAGTQSRATGDGSGLGLYISRKIANILGGELDVKSRYNRGSEFSLSLPRARKPESS